MQKSKFVIAVAIAMQFIIPSSYASDPAPRPYPSLPTELTGKGISISSLREILYEPMFIDGANETPDTFSNLEVGTAFVGGQDAINTQISNVQTARNESDPNTKMCDGYLDANCAGIQKIATVILPVCVDGLSGACIESFALKSNSSYVSGTHTGYINNEYSTPAKEDIYSDLENSGDAFWDTIRTTDVQSLETWDGVPARKLPTASSPSKWQVTGINNAAGVNTYMVNARLTFYFTDGAPTLYSSMTAEVIPYKEITGNNFQPPFWVTRDVFHNVSDRNSNSNRRYTETFPTSPRYPLASYDNPDQGQHLTCAYEEINEITPNLSKCGAAVRFADDTKVKLSLRIPKELGGWFHGRLSDTDAELSSHDDELNLLTISANAVDVPITSYQFQACDPNQQTYADMYFPSAVDSPDWNKTQFCTRAETDGLGSWGHWGPGSITAVNDFTDYEALMDPRAKGTVNTWSISSLSFDEGLNSCFSDTSLIQGFISTNALVYQAGLPIFTAGKFDYRIASTHYDAEANEIKGDYTLEVRSSVARCIWGLGNKALKAAVKVKGSSNQDKNFTSSFSDSDGWIRISVKDFTFSESNVSLELAEEVTASGSSSTGSSAAATTNFLSLSTKGKVSKNAIANQFGLTPTKNAVISMTLSKASKKVCKQVGSSVTALKAGTCSVTISVQEPKPKPVKISNSVTYPSQTSLSKQQLIELSGRSWVPKSTVTIKISSSSKKTCSVKSGKLSIKPGSNCSYSLVLSEPKPKVVKATGTIQVN